MSKQKLSKSKPEINPGSKLRVLAVTLSKKTGIDKIYQEMLYSETKRWNQVFQRIVAIVQFLAERDLAL